MDTMAVKVKLKPASSPTLLSAFLSLLLSGYSHAVVAQEPLEGSEIAGAGTNSELMVADSEFVTGNTLSSTFEPVAPQLSVSEEADLVFNILSAEIAGRRGLVGIASENYFDASEATDDPRVSERATKLALYGRDWQRAEMASARWIELDSENVEAWQHRAQALIQLEDVELATDAIEQIVELSDNESGSVIPSVVDSILRQADPAVGSKLLENLAERYPDNAESQYGIGRFAMSKGERKFALKAFERALAIDPDNVETLLSRARLQLSAGEGDSALEPVTDYLTRSPDDLSAQLGYVRILIDSSKVDRAADQLETIYTAFPEDEDALYTIGLLALDIQRLSSAEKYLSTVAALDKYQDDANYYLGRISDNRRDYRQSIDRYLSVRGGDNFFSAQSRAAELYGVVGEIDQSRNLFAELRSLTDDSALQVELISTESQVLNSDNQYDESLKLLSDSLAQYRDDPILLYSRALLADKLGDHRMFETDLQKVIEVQPDNSFALNALGYYLVERNERLSIAEEYLVRAYELTPEDAAITDSLGWLYYRQGRYVASLKLLQKAYNVLPDPEIAAHLGEVLWVTGDQDKATKVWEEALRQAPDYDLLQRVMKKYIR